MSKYVYGIDLGTTYSCIAYQDEDGRPTVIKNMDTNADTTPSVVQWGEDGTISLHAKKVDTGEVVDAVFKSENVMSKEEIEEAKARVSTGLQMQM